MRIDWGGIVPPMQPMQHAPAIVVAPILALAARLARHCESSAREAQAARGRFSIAVPGGSVAEHLLPALAAADLEWDSVDVFFAYERCVPPESPDSNFGAVARTLLSGIRTGKPRVHRMEGERSDTEHVAIEYADRLRSVLGAPPVLDVALLGVGEDGHVAALFPGRPSLRAADSLVLVEDASPKPPAHRLTLSLQVLARSREVVVGAFGTAKATAVADALRNSASTLPLTLLLQRANRVTLLLDQEAASRVR